MSVLRGWCLLPWRGFVLHLSINRSVACVSNAAMCQLLYNIGLENLTQKIH